MAPRHVVGEHLEDRLTKRGQRNDGWFCPGPRGEGALVMRTSVNFHIPFPVPNQREMVAG